MDERLILETISENYPKDLLKKEFSDCPDTDLNLLGIITVIGENIYFTDKFNNIRKMLWNKNTRPNFLCSGLVMHIIGEKQMVYGKPTNIIVKDYKFPPPTMTKINTVTTPIAICHTFNSIDRIRHIVKEVETRDIFIMGVNAEEKFAEMVDTMKSVSNKMFHIMPGDRDFVSTKLPLAFGFKNFKNIHMKEIPHQHERILFLNRKLHLEKMIQNSNLKMSVIEMMKLILDSKQIFPSNRVDRKRELTHNSVYLICDGDELVIETYKNSRLIILPPEKILIVDQKTHDIINL